MAKSKSFTVDMDNPALKFISGGEEEKKPPAKREAQEEKKRGRGRPVTDTENKSKRFSLLLQPSVYSDILKLANMNEVSANEQIMLAIKEYVENHRDLIRRYDEFKGK